MIQLYSFDKPIGDLGPARDDTDGIDTFYMEREWKIIPFRASIENGTIKKTEDGNYYLPFSRTDIRVLIVPNNDTKIQFGVLFAEFKR